MNEKETIADHVIRECVEYNSWLDYYGKAKDEGLSDLQAAEFADEKCEENEVSV